MIKAIIFNGPGSVSVGKVMSRPVTTGEVKVKINFVGICGSDLSTYMGKNPMVGYPVVPGHEVSRMIVEAGKGCTGKAYLKTGSVPYTNCGQCYACKNGRPHVCRFNQTLGVQRNGTMTEFINLPFDKILFGGMLLRKEGY